jgi:class 3 adenylate cyclase
MEPRIQYAKTSDGVSIAFAVHGEGRALVLMPPWPFCHLEAEWWVPTYRLWHERLAEKTRLVRFDPRGSGLSQRDVDDLSLDARVLDLKAVADHLALNTLDLMGYGGGGHVAVTYAVRNPDRVAHLILYSSYARSSEMRKIPQLQGLLALMNSDWEMFTETMAHVFFGWSAGEPARKFAEYLRECATPEQVRVAFAVGADSDVSSLLPQVSTPTMVLRAREGIFPGAEITRALASAIPNASLTTIDGAWLTSVEIVEAVVRTFYQFLGVGEAGAPVEAGAFRTVLFTDVEGSTALTQRLGDAKARELLREHERIVREALKAQGGSEVKTMGDGFMASFSSATKALECAIAMQRAFAAHNESAQEPIRVRIGLNAGEPIAEDDPDGRSDLFGTAVNLAARIAAKADGGQILTSDTVRGLVAGKKFLFSDRGETAMRGFEDPVRLYEVRWREEGG